MVSRRMSAPLGKALPRFLGVDYQCTDNSHLRLRTWNSLQTIDVLTSFILGKPKSLPVVRHGTCQREMTGEEGSQHLHSAFDAVLKGCSLLDDIVDKLPRGSVLHVPTAEGLLEQLRQWSQSFPPDWLRFSF